MDGINNMVPKDKMAKGARKFRDAYEIKPDAPIYQCEFGYYSLERWRADGHIPEDAGWDWISEQFGFDAGGGASLGRLGWCEAPFLPIFDEVVLEDRGDYELAQDFAGRKVLYFRGRRSGFMPEYVDHPVKDEKSWQELCLWRMDPNAPGRLDGIEDDMLHIKQCAAEGRIVTQGLVGGYMYLRSLIGPTELLYMFYDNPKLIHACMQAWFDVSDKVIAEHQKHVTLDEVFIAEDICYNKGPLISVNMMKEFLLPYYQQLIANVKKRQIDKQRHLYFKVDTDGFADPAIPFYRGLGLDVMTPFEVAAGCDVLRTAEDYPDLVIWGGIDKRVLSKSLADIDEMVDRIMPPMVKRGGYIPTCDHGVPEEVPFAHYMHFRKRMLEFA